MYINTKLKIVSILILILLTILDTYWIKPITGKTIIYVDDDFITEDATHKRTIQSAINIAKPGDAIRVAAGTYYENVYINLDALELIGENPNSTLIDGRGVGDTIHITADNVKITGFTIRNSGSNYPNSGLFLSATAERCHIFNNRVISNKGHGVFLMWSNDNVVSNNIICFNSEAGIRIDVSKNTIANNVIEKNSDGIFLYVAYNCIIENNTISNNLKSGITPQGGSRNITIRNNVITYNGWNGIFFYASNTSVVEQNVLSNNKWGIQMVDDSNSNKIIKNEILNNQEGVVLTNSFKNIIRNNRIEKNKHGIKLSRSSGNEISYNNFINNEQQVEISESTKNAWDDGSKGNYWSDYRGVDSNNDGIGDTPYVIDSNNRDNCPLINKPNIFGQHEKTKTILLDVYHSGHDFSSFTSLQRELISQGFNIKKLSGPLSATSLSSCSILWIDGCFFGNKFSNSDLAMIVDFVNNGGALFLTINGWIWIPYGTSETNRTIHNYPGNMLARCFGVVSNNDYYIDDVNKHPMIRDQECFIDHPITQGVHRLDTAYGVISTLNVSNGVVIIRGSKYSESTWGLGPYKKGSYPPLLVAIQYGKGRIVITGLSNNAFSDADSDKDGIADIDEFDNKLLALNIFSWLSEQTGLFRYTAIIPGTWLFDVDSGKTVGLDEAALADLLWEQVTKTERYLVPLNGAKIANLGIVDLDSITDCSDYPLSEQKIDGSIGSNTIPNGTVLIIKTNMGKYAKMRIDSYGYNLHVTVVYQGDGTTQFKKTSQATYKIILRANLPTNYFWAKLDAENKTGSTILFKVSGIEHVILVPSEIVVGRTRYIFSKWSNGMTQNPMTIRLTEDTELTAIYRTEVFLEVSSELGTTSGSGWYKVNDEVTLSIYPTVVERDFFANYVFEGWRLDGSIVSTLPTYSFVVDGPVTLVASWRTEVKPVAIGLISGIIILIIATTAILIVKRKHKPSPPTPPTPPTPIESETEKEIRKLEEYLERLEQLRKEGKVSETVYEKLKEEYEKRLEELVDKLKK